MDISNSNTAQMNWWEEKNSAFLYRYMAKDEADIPNKATLFLNLANAAEEQATIWAAQLRAQNILVPTYTPSFRIKFIAQLIRYVGTRPIKPILASMKIRGLSVYMGDMPGHSTADTKTSNNIKKHDEHHVFGNSGSIRAAVFGINDGLVSSASLILGVVGATNNMSFIILSGISGLAAGAFSMAAGEYISMRSQRELFEYQIALEKAELELYPEEEAKELSYIYQARGLSEIDADSFANKMLSNTEQALHTLAREELGLNPDELGSPWKAALASFGAFALGGFVPLIPFLFNTEKMLSLSIILSIFFTGLSLFVVGVILSLYTGRNALLSGLRMLSIGALAGITTFLIGYLVGVNVS